MTLNESYGDWESIVGDSILRGRMDRLLSLAKHAFNFRISTFTVIASLNCSVSGSSRSKMFLKSLAMTYLLGPFLALLPKRWRERLWFGETVNWRRSAILCGLMQTAISLCALVYWYSYSVSHWAQRALSSALDAHPEVGYLEPSILGLMAYILVILHPITWLIAWWGIEGVVRISAAVLTGEVFGTLPLILVDRALPRVRRQYHLETSAMSGSVEFSSGQRRTISTSLCAVLRRRYFEMRLPLVPDKVSLVKVSTGETLEICSCRMKPDWELGCLVCYQEQYYRIVEFTERRSQWPRPFVFSLLRLPAGVPGRTVIAYCPREVIAS